MTPKEKLLKKFEERFELEKITKLPNRMDNTQEYLIWFTILTIIAMSFILWVAIVRTHTILDPRCTIRGQEIATKCDLQGLGNSITEENLYLKLNALANHFRLEFVEKDNEYEAIANGKILTSWHSKDIEVIKQRRK